MMVVMLVQHVWSTSQQLVVLHTLQHWPAPVWLLWAVVKPAPGKRYVLFRYCWHACPLPPGHHQEVIVVESDSALARAPHLMTLAARTFFHLASVSGDQSNNAPQAIRFPSIQSDQHRQFVAIPFVSEHSDELEPRILPRSSIAAEHFRHTRAPTLWSRIAHKRALPITQAQGGQPIPIDSAIAAFAFSRACSASGRIAVTPILASNI